MSYDGTRLREWRIEHNWSQRMVADKVGVAVRTVYGWEKGQPPLERHQRALEKMMANEGQS